MFIATTNCTGFKRTIYNVDDPLHGIVTNCDGEYFLIADNQGQPFMNGFEIHVTAVYNPGQIESGYLQTSHSYGAAIATRSFTYKKAMLFPNPTNGIFNIGNEDLEKIVVYNISGAVVREFAPNSQIDLSKFPKGLYIIKLFSDSETIVDKIVLQ